MSKITFEEFDENLERAVIGDEYAKGRLLEFLKPLVISSIKRYCPIYDEFEDLYSDGILVILECLETFDGKRSFLKYVKSYLKYYYFETFRYLKNLDCCDSHIMTEDGEEELINLVADDFIIEENFLEKEELELLVDSIGLLTDRQREILNLYYFQNLSLTEISEYLRISRWTVVNLKRNAITNLRRVLSDFR